MLSNSLQELTVQEEKIDGHLTTGCREEATETPGRQRQGAEWSPGQVRVQSKTCLRQTEGCSALSGPCIVWPSPKAQRSLQRGCGVSVRARGCGWVQGNSGCWTQQGSCELREWQTRCWQVEMKLFEGDTTEYLKKTDLFYFYLCVCLCASLSTLMKPEESVRSLSHS